MDTVNEPTWYIYSLIVCYIVFALYKKKFSYDSATFWLVCAFLCIGGSVYKIDLPIFHEDTFRALLAFSLGCALAIKTKSCFHRRRHWKWLLGEVVVVAVLFLMGGIEIAGDFEKVLLVSFYPFCILSATIIGQLPIFKLFCINWIEKYFREISMYFYCIIYLVFYNK